MTIGQAMKAARKSKGVSQAKLGEKSGINPIIISWWETDKHTPTITLLICIADALGVTLDELVGRNMQENKKNFQKTY
jgi:transcriptional regulator with XRE-family HTH domain